MLQRGWFLPQGDFSGMHAWLFMTKGDCWGVCAQPAPALLHRGDDRLDSTCAGGCDPPAARCCQPALPAGPMPHGVCGSLQGGQCGEEGTGPSRARWLLGWELS